MQFTQSRASIQLFQHTLAPAQATAYVIRIYTYARCYHIPHSLISRQPHNRQLEMSSNSSSSGGGNDGGGGGTKSHPLPASVYMQPPQFKAIERTSSLPACLPACLPSMPIIMCRGGVGGCSSNTMLLLGLKLVHRPRKKGALHHAQAAPIARSFARSFDGGAVQHEYERGLNVLSTTAVSRGHVASL